MTIVNCKTCRFHRKVFMDGKELTIIYCNQHKRHVWPSQQCSFWMPETEIDNKVSKFISFTKSTLADQFRELRERPI